MPLESELRAFSSEADFTSRFITPLLRRLGFSIVAEYHGQREFGKDVVFGELDRFGQVVYHGLQSKFQDSIGQSDSEKLIDDCRQAFRHTFRHPATGAEHRIATFVVVNAGSIADNARANFFTAAENAEHGGAVKMLDGKALLALDRWVTINRIDNLGQVLAGVLIEIRYNRIMQECIDSRIQEIVTDKGDLLPSERLRTAALSRYVERPVLPDSKATDLALEYLYVADCLVNDLLDYLRSCSSNDNERIKRHGEAVLRNGKRAAAAGDKLELLILAAQQTLGPLAAI